MVGVVLRRVGDEQFRLSSLETVSRGLSNLPPSCTLLLSRSSLLSLLSARLTEGDKGIGLLRQPFIASVLSSLSSSSSSSARGNEEAQSIDEGRRDGPKSLADGSLLRGYKGAASDLLTRGCRKMNKGANGRRADEERFSRRVRILTLRGERTRGAVRCFR